MNVKAFALAGALVVAISSGAPVMAGASGSDGAHAHEGLEHETLELNEGQKWQTDAPLRQGMEGVRDTLKDELQVIHQNTLEQDDYLSLADQVDAHVGFMFENCELPPKADAQLHTLLAHILAGTDQMRDGENARAGAVQVVNALDAYSRHFDHEGWTSLSH